MTKLTVCAAVSALLLLSACGGETKPEANSCSSSEANDLVAKMVKENVEKGVMNFLNADDSGALGDIGVANVREALAQIKISLGDVRTTEKSDTTTKQKCEASLQLALPENMLRQAAETNKLLSDSAKSTTDFFETDYRHEGPYYIKNIAYSVQPTDDKTKLFVTLETPSAISAPIEKLVGLFLLSNPVQSQVQAQADELAALNAEQMQAQLNTANEDYKLADGDLNKYWRSLPESLRSKLKNSQTAWIGSRDSECAFEAQSGAQDAVAQQILAINCKTEKTRSRLTELQQMAEASIGDMGKEAQQKANQAMKRLQTAVNKLPKEIADQLAGDYNNWVDESKRKCQVENFADSATAEIDALNCTAKEFNAKAKELEGYSIN